MFVPGVTPDVLSLLIEALSLATSGPEARKLAEQAEINQQARHDAAESSAHERHVEALDVGKEQLQKLAAVFELQTEQLEMGKEGLRLQHSIEMRQNSQFSIQNKQAWARFRQTPEGEFYRAWEKAAFRLLGVVSARDEALHDMLTIESERLSTQIEHSDTSTEGPQEPILEKVSPPQPPPKEPLRSDSRKLTERAQLIDRQGTRGCLVGSLAILVVVVGGLASAIAAGVGWIAGTGTPRWASILPWWLWIALLGAAALATMVTIFVNVSRKDYEEKEFDPEAYQKTYEQYLKEKEEWEEGESHRKRLDMLNRSRMADFEQSRAEFEEQERRTKLEIASKQNELARISSFDWMQDSHRGRAAVREIINTVTRGRLEHPEPSELPVLRLPAARRAQDGPTAAVRDWLERLSDEEDPTPGAV